MGIAPPGVLEARAREPNAAQATPGPSAQVPEPSAPRAPGLQQTMIGIAPPGPKTPSAGLEPVISQPSPRPVVDRGYPTPPPPPEVPLQPRPHSAGGTLPQLAPHQKTMLGVARPGIAPLNPGQAKASVAPGAAVPPHSVTVPLHAAAPRRPLAVPEPVAVGAKAARTAPVKPRIPTLAALAIVAAGALFAAASVVWLFYRGHGSIEARAQSLPDGTEQLELSCLACDDGTVSRLDAATATFTAHRATLPLTRPLKVGENPMTITLVSPRAKQTFVDISVPIAFRVRGDTSGLDAPTPELRVLVNALPGRAPP